MSEDSVVRFRTRGSVEDPLTEVLRAGARRLLERATEAEVAELLASGTTKDERPWIATAAYRLGRC